MNFSRNFQQSGYERIDEDLFAFINIGYKGHAGQIFPNKYDEKVGERGFKLSGGQRQRIGIARALYRNSKLIIFDEPTNALDLDTENLVLNSISNLENNVTVILITHSKNSLKFCDQIIDLSNQTKI